MLEQKEELVKLRSDKVEHESKILYQSEKIKQLTLESEMKLRHANELESKLSRALSEVENKNYELKNLEKSMNEMRIKIEAN